MRRNQLPPHKTATYVLPRYKTVYVSVPKAACTSLKWLVARVAGRGSGAFPSIIESRSRARDDDPPSQSVAPHANAPRIVRRGAGGDLADDGWFVFAVVRHPSARLWSAWQSKFLLREPRWVDEFADAPWLPRHPRSAEDVVEDFGRFVESIASDPSQPVMRDRHFMTQTELVARATTPTPTCSIPVRSSACWTSLAPNCAYTAGRDVSLSSTATRLR